MQWMPTDFVCLIYLHYDFKTGKSNELQCLWKNLESYTENAEINYWIV